MASQDKGSKGMQKIKDWIESNTFEEPSDREMTWLQLRHEEGVITDDDVVGAGVYAHDTAREEALQNESLRERALVDPPKVNLMFWVDAADDDKNLTMLRDDVEKLATREAAKDPRHLRTVAALAKIYHRIRMENLQLGDEILLVESAKAWFEDRERQDDRLGEQNDELSDPKFNARTLKVLAIHFRCGVESNRRKFYDVREKVNLEESLDLPDVSGDMVDREPKADPDLFVMNR